MKVPSQIGVWVRLLLALSAISLLRIAPRPHQADRDLQEARLALEAGEPGAASTHLAQAASRLPGRADLWEKAGLVALQAGDPQAAIYRLEVAMARGEISLQGHLALGDA